MCFLFFLQIDFGYYDFYRLVGGNDNKQVNNNGIKKYKMIFLGINKYYEENKIYSCDSK